MAPDVVQRQAQLLAAGEVVLLSAELICAAISHRTRHGLSFWDACILAAAEHAGCSEICSEDFSAGQAYGTVRVANPFVS